MGKIKNVISRQRWVSIVLATFVLGILLSFLSPAFLDFGNFENIIVQSSITAIMTVGMTFIIMTGGIDISVGAILFFTGSLFAQMLESGFNVWLAIVVTIVSAAILGALNGILVVYTKMAPFIVTLATYNVYRGIALRITNAGNIPVPREASFLGTSSVGVVPTPIVILLVILAVGLILAKYTRFGIYTKAIGNSRVSAHESGLPVNKTLIIAYMLGGLTAGISGLVLIGRIGGLQSGLGLGEEFSVIAAVVLGGTKLSGGSGSLIGSIIGSIFLLLINNGLNLVGVDIYLYEVVTGVVLIAAVLIDRLSVNKQELSLLEAKKRRMLKIN